MTYKQMLWRLRYWLASLAGAATVTLIEPDKPNTVMKLLPGDSVDITQHPPTAESLEKEGWRCAARIIEEPVPPGTDMIASHRYDPPITMAQHTEMQHFQGHVWVRENKQGVTP